MRSVKYDVCFVQMMSSCFVGRFSRLKLLIVGHVNMWHHSYLTAYRLDVPRLELSGQGHRSPER